LIAPPGLGKGYVAQALAHEFAESDSAARVLVLAPRPLTSAFAAALAEFEPKYSVDVVDRRRLRELLSPDEPAAIWPAQTVVVMSTDFAKQDDVLTLLTSIRWSLVIIDEAHALEGRRKQLVRRLAASADRLLLLAAVEGASRVADAVPDLVVVRWERDVTDADGKPLFASVPRAHHVIEYERSEPEAAFAREVLTVMDHLLGTPTAPQVALTRRVMLNALASSPNAIEQFLLRQIDRLRGEFDFVRQPKEGDDDESDDSHEEVDTEGPFVDSQSMWTERGAALSALASLVAQLDGVRTDTKAMQLRELVRELRVEQSSHRTCIFSTFGATAEYLAAVLYEVTDVALLTARMTQDERIEAVGKFRGVGGVLIATGAAHGLDLALANVAVHYDLPEGHLQMEHRWGRLDRVGQTSTVHGYAFRDVRRTLDWEEELLRRHGFIP
jgi:superfamily II DNA or RNA helicase